MQVPLWIKILAGVCILTAVAMMWFFRDEIDDNDDSGVP